MWKNPILRTFVQGVSIQFVPSARGIRLAAASSQRNRRPSRSARWPVVYPVALRLDGDDLGVAEEAVNKLAGRPCRRRGATGVTLVFRELTQHRHQSSPHEGDRGMQPHAPGGRASRLRGPPRTREPETGSGR